MRELSFFMRKYFRRNGVSLVHDVFEEFAGPQYVRSAEVLTSLSPGDDVLILTGFKVPPKFSPETDGPPGTAFLSGCLLGLGLKPHVVVERGGVYAVMKSALDAVGLRDEVMLRAAPEGKGSRSELALESLVMDVNPSLIVFVEKPGPNKLGEYHTMRGFNVTNEHIDVLPILNYARENNVITVGVGDGGNEVGMGVVEEYVRKYVPYGNLCNCPCRSGIASSARTRYLIIAPTSNWGVYALAGAVWRELRVPQCLTSWAFEEAVLSAMLEAGAVDGVKGVTTFSVDSIGPKDLFTFQESLRTFLASEGSIAGIP